MTQEADLAAQGKRSKQKEKVLSIVRASHSGRMTQKAIWDKMRFKYHETMTIKFLGVLLYEMLTQDKMISGKRIQKEEGTVAIYFLPKDQAGTQQELPLPDDAVVVKKKTSPFDEGMKQPHMIKAMKDLGLSQDA